MAMTAFEKARVRLVQQHVFYATVIMMTPWYKDDSVGTACTNYKSVKVSPSFIESLPVPVVMFVMVHEIMHIMLKHNLRCGHRHRLLWNWATDVVINLILKQGGFTLWQHAIVDMKAIGLMTVYTTKWTAEEVYDDIVKYLKGQGIDPGSIDSQACGPGSGDLKPEEFQDMDPTEQAAASRAVDQMVAQAHAAAQGRMPAGLELLINDMFKPHQPWEQILRDFMLQCVRSEESWTRRNRRYEKVVLPGRHGHGMGELVIIGDTSGSMMQENILNQMGSEINGAIQALSPTLTRVIWADDEDCASQDIFEEGAEVVLKPKGGGGTDMRKALKFVEQYEPICVVLITDGYTPWPAEPTPFPLIVAFTNAKGPDWAMNVKVSINA